MQKTQCPGCAAELVFDVPGAIVKVCAYCRSVIARGDKGFEDLGKVADVTDSSSPLALNLEGAYEGVRFSLTGRTLLAHAAGGTWEEWYAHFDDDRWGWLAEAQGRFYLTFETAGDTSHLPANAALTAGASVEVAGEHLRVIEVGEARYQGAQGELPFRLDPKERLIYADLSGAAGRFATLDYTEGLRLYVGREVTLEQLGLAGKAAAERTPASISSARMACPECDGALELRAPDHTERVGCPYCGALLDVNQGKLTALKSLSGPKISPALALGATAELEGAKYTVLGFLRRSVEIDGVRYSWDEYLLFARPVGFRWLVESDGHWSFVTPIAVGDVLEKPGLAVAFAGKDYRMFQRATARVDYVLGEMTWKVQVGEQVLATDYVAAPDMVSEERSVAAAGDLAASEVAWSHGVYVPVATVEQAFGVKLQAPARVAPHQPWPHAGAGRIVLAALAAIVALAIGISMWHPSRSRAELAFTLEPPAAGNKTTVAFSEPFDLSGQGSIEVEAMTSSVSNSWLYVEGDLVSEDTGLTADWDAELEEWHGSDEDGPWNEGSRDATTYVSAVPPGRYTLRVEAAWSDLTKPAALVVRVAEGGFRASLFLWLAGLVGGTGLLFVGAHARFEKRRWEDKYIEGMPHEPSATEDDE